MNYGAIENVRYLIAYREAQIHLYQSAEPSACRISFRRTERENCYKGLIIGISDDSHKTIDTVPHIRIIPELE